jgi:hypothetical protein
MKHFREMTFAALSNRADSVEKDDVVSEIIGGDDHRAIYAFLSHEQADLGEDCGYRLVAKELIGVALADLDDPAAPIEILDRNQAVDLFGWRYVADLENVDE